MKTNFFNNIEAMGCPGQWQITIHADEKGNFTVSTHFTAKASGDNAAKHIIPFAATGTAADFDAGYFEQLERPIKEISGLLTNMEQFIKSVAKAKEQSKMVQDNNPKNKPKGGSSADGVEMPDTAKMEEKRKAYTDAIRKVVELDGLCKYEEALAILPTAADYPEKEPELAKRKGELERKKEQKANLLF